MISLNYMIHRMMSIKKARSQITRRNDNLTRFNRDANPPISLSASCSSAHSNDHIETLITEADRRMDAEIARVKAVQKAMER